MEEINSCMKCLHKDKQSDGTRRSFYCLRFPSRLHITEWPQNYTCGEFKLSDKPQEVPKKKVEAGVEEVKVVENKAVDDKTNVLIDTMMKKGTK